MQNLNLPLTFDVVSYYIIDDISNNAAVGVAGLNAPNGPCPDTQIVFKNQNVNINKCLYEIIKYINKYPRTFVALQGISVSYNEIFESIKDNVGGAANYNPFLPNNGSNNASLEDIEMKINGKQMAIFHDNNMATPTPLRIGFTLKNSTGSILMSIYKYLNYIKTINNEDRYICVINVDANNGDISTFDDDAFTAINSMQNKDDILKILKKCDIIMLGNFNSNLQNYIYDYKINNNNYKIFRIFTHRNFNNPGGRFLFNINLNKFTCCYGNNFNGIPSLKYDHILSTFMETKYTNQPILQNERPQSTHLPVRASIKAKLRIGYDFDGVIHKDVYPAKNGLRSHLPDVDIKHPFTIIINKIKEQISNSWDVYIITVRMQSAKNFIKQFLSANGLNIPDNNIIFAAGGIKLPYIKEYMINEFYDDSCKVISDLYTSKKRGELPLLTNIYLVIPENDEFIDIDETNYNQYCNSQPPSVNAPPPSVNVPPVVNVEKKEYNKQPPENIIVLTYNVYFKAMNSAIPPCINDACLNNVIHLLSNNGPYTFVGIQEITNVDKIKNIHYLRNMSSVFNRSGLEQMLTFYDQTKFELKKNLSFDYSSPGRPINMLFYKYLNGQNKDRIICVINLHRDHEMVDIMQSFDRQAKEAIKQDADKNNIIEMLKTCDIIAMGDFNSFLDNLKKYNNNPVFTIFNDKFFDNPGGRILFNKNSIPTCCYNKQTLQGQLTKNYDHILASFQNISYTNIEIINTAKSDHIPLKATITVERKIGYNINDILNDHDNNVNLITNIMNIIKEQLSFSWKIYIIIDVSKIGSLPNILNTNGININDINIINSTNIMDEVKHKMIEMVYCDNCNVLSSIENEKRKGNLPILTTIYYFDKNNNNNNPIEINKNNIHTFCRNIRLETPISPPKKIKTSHKPSKGLTLPPSIKEKPFTIPRLKNLQIPNITQNDIDITPAHPLPILLKSTYKPKFNLHMGFSDLLKKLNDIVNGIHNNDQLEDIADCAIIINTIVKNYDYKFDNPKINLAIDKLKQTIHDFIINKNISKTHLEYINLLELNTILLMTLEFNIKLENMQVGRKSFNTKNVEFSIMNTINYFTTLFRTNPQLESYINNILRTTTLQDQDYQLLQTYNDYGFSNDMSYIMVILNIILTKLMGRNVF